MSRAPIIEEGPDIQLSLIHPIYKTKTVVVRGPDGSKYKEQRDVVAKEIRVKRWFRKAAVINVQEYITVDNTIAKNRCVIYDNYTNQSFTVAHSPDDIRNVTRMSKQILGFNQKNYY